MALDILLFLTWKTWRNRLLIDEGMADELVRLLPGLARLESAIILELAVIPNHVHVVVRTTVQPDLPAIAQRLKGTSARIINRGRDGQQMLHWARGYDVRSFGRRDLPFIRRYFDRQSARHGFDWVARYSIDSRPTAGVLQHAPLAESAL